MKQKHSLYKGSVIITSDDEATRNRYIVTDGEKVNQPVRGVTTLLGNVFDKPGLRGYPLNMATSYLFGAKFDEVLGRWVYDASKALLRPGTTYTSEELDNALNEAVGASKRKAKDGRDTGTEIHQAIEDFLRSKGTITFSKEAAKAVQSFKNWYAGQNIKLLEVERLVYSREYEYAGRFDCILEIDGKIVLVDIKTTNSSRAALRDRDGKWTGIYPENFLQLGLYSVADKEETERRIDDLIVINVNKQGQVFTLSLSELGIPIEDCENMALSAVQLHNFLSKTLRVKPAEVYKDN